MPGRRTSAVSEARERIVPLASSDIRLIEEHDIASILAINRDARPHVAPLDRSEVARLRGLEARIYVATARTVCGYLIAIPSGSAYDAEEFRLLREQLNASFLYIDQVAVAPQARRSGLGSSLYRKAETVALATGATFVSCEVNLAPPNQASLQFHERLGFGVIRECLLEDGRRVALMARRL